MPELKHEIPSTEELRVYLNEHFATSTFAVLDAPDEQLRQYGEKLGSVLISLKRTDAPVFGKLAFDTLLAGLIRLNGVPRDDPFWTNTNLRPTYYKLADFVRRLAAENPDDEGALWLQAVLPVWQGAERFGQESWLRLHRLGGLDVRWPIYAALITQICVDYAANFTVRTLVDYVREAGTIGPSLGVLRQIAEATEGTAVSWARGVIELLLTA